MDDAAQGAGWLTFAGIMVLIAGILNVIWGIAAIDSGLSAYGGQRSRAATG